jgi:hypothetical protein
MLTEEDVRGLLLQKTETKNLDYKRTCHWLNATNDDRCEIVKDILAMSNTQDGGQIVFGVDDRGFESVGMAAPDFESFDPTRLNDFIRRYTDPSFACNVYKFTIDGRRTVVIEVPEFTEVPILCKVDANSADEPRRVILKRGGLYVRTDRPSSELVSSVEDMRDIIGRASRKKREELLRTIRSLIEGEVVAPAVDAQRTYGEEIQQTAEFFAQTLPREFGSQGHWAVDAHPTQYDSGRVASHAALSDLIRTSTVALRGWDFPHTDRENASNFGNGRQSHTSFWHHIEAYRAYFSGFFGWRSALWENERVPDQRVLSFIGVILSTDRSFPVL